MMNTDFYRELTRELDSRHVTLVAVSKTHPVEEIRALYAMGQRVFGENRVQELLEKQPFLPEDIRWHLIGHLQRNKVKQCLHAVSMIESVDSVRLIREIEKEARKTGIIVDILLQIHIAEEESKYGFNPETMIQELVTLPLAEIQNIRFRGVMGMASFVDNTAQVRDEFRSLKRTFDTLRQTLFQETPHFDQISMGMSGDYQIAIEEGSTNVRIGSLIFGERG